MKCFNCQKDIVDDSLYCSFCGKLTSIVPDYSIYDDDNINVLLEGAETARAQKSKEEASLKEEQRKLAEQKKLEADRKKEELKKAKLLELKKKKQMRLTISMVALVCVFLIVCGIFIKMYVDNSNANSYSYQVKMAESAFKEKDYRTAVTYYKKAIELKPDDLSVRLDLVDLYFIMNEEFKAIKLLEETIEQDKTAYDAYKELLSYYEKQNDIESIKILLDGVTNNRVKNLFKNYIVENPRIHLEGGTYNNSIRITVSAKMGTSIYYTIDGSNPEKKGVLYSNAIVLDKKGTFTLKVVAKNEKGMFSDIVSEKYIIRIEAPDDPIISNTKTNEIIEGGTFTEETYLTIHVPSGCNAYFTWDNTDPDKESGTLYTEPVMVPEGDNILSVIIIDEENEQESIIFRGRFEYYPEEGTTDAV